MEPFATVTDISTLWRPLVPTEAERAEALLPLVSDTLRQEAKNVKKDLDEMILNGEVLESVVKSVTIDIVSRMLLASTTAEPMTQFSQSALGYTASGTFLVPGGGFFVKKSELARLGLKKQKYGVLELYDTWNNSDNC